MTIRTTTLRPGYLVSMKTSVRGNVAYERRDIEKVNVAKDGSMTSAWETRKTIIDKEEFDLAHSSRSRARSLISNLCVHTAFGDLCPEDRREDLDKAVAEARAVVDECNATAKITRLGFYVIVGRIAPDDVEAVRAINSEVRDLMEEMTEGLKNLDANVVRKAASKAKGLGAMLTGEAQARIQIAIDSARSAAKKIAKAAEQGAVEVDRLAIRTITESRTAFLDLDEGPTVAAPKAERRAIDLTPADDGSLLRKKEKAKAAQLEL